MTTLIGSRCKRSNALSRGVLIANLIGKFENRRSALFDRIVLPHTPFEALLFYIFSFLLLDVTFGRGILYFSQTFQTTTKCDASKGVVVYRIKISNSCAIINYV